MAKKRILILGGGLAGLSAAWHLQKKSIDCRIFEKETEIGGLCRSKSIRGFIFDYDGHLLHFRNRSVFNLVKGLLAENLLEHKRSAWVYCYGRRIRYPFQANLYGLPSSVIKECLLGLIRASRDNHDHRKAGDLTFRSWINQVFGKGIARHFMVPYNTKFWTLPPEKLTCEWLADFVPVPSLSETLEGTIEDTPREFGYNATFWYPRKGGINQVSLSLAGEVKNIHTGLEVTEIDPARKKVMTASGIREGYDQLIYTLPLPEIARLIKNSPSAVKAACRKLRWNSILNVNLGVNRNNLPEMHWVYFPHKESCFFRVGFYHNFSQYIVPRGMSSLYVEVSYSKDAGIDKEKILSRIKRDLCHAGVLSGKDETLVTDINDIKYGYPIYDIHYKAAREKIIKYLNQNHIIPCGRYGAWRYFSMEDTILDGRRVAGII